MTAAQLVPIRKIAVAAISAGLIYIAARLGLVLPSEQAQEAAQGIVPVLLAYLTPDPKVNTASTP